MDSRGFLNPLEKALRVYAALVLALLLFQLLDDRSGTFDIAYRLSQFRILNPVFKFRTTRFH